MAKSRIPNYLDVRDLISHKKWCLISNEREMTYPATCPSWFRCWGGTHSSELFSICIFSSTENQWWSRIQQCSLEKLVHSCLVLLYSGANLLVTSNRCCSKPIQLGEDCVLLCGWHKVPVPMWMCLFWFGITKWSVSLWNIYPICRADGVEMLMWVNICHIRTAQSGCILAHTL